ncbi:MAG TPA: septal ring lytic transglycosylase RlpA family protein [Steroidobacteraceae bacterium]|nr:septal ring lytic transglycosylase RlpA family protein [Steroidobacteraceae bacterium]
MRSARALAPPLCLLVAAGVSACFSPPPRPERPSPSTVAPPQAAETPPPPDSVPDMVPRAEARSRNGNPPFYDVMGKRYFVLSSSVGYVERGVASWYGPGFHKVRTSTGEPYDMYGMTAAHKTLPLPAYVRVTNLQNGRSIVVRVNDRGPFVGNRIIDLSYTAAAKLDMLRNGTAMVEVRSLEPVSAGTPLVAQTTAPGAAPSSGPAADVSTVAVPRALYIQAGAFSDPQNAERLMEKLRGGGYGKVFVRDNEIAGRRMFRVRIGPVPDVAEFDRVVAALQRVGVGDAHLALD